MTNSTYTSRQPHACGRSARTHRRKEMPEYRAWCMMKSRCRNEKLAGYKRYGGRGIAVCERWETFENFFADMGCRPSPVHSLDRIDNNGNYEPSNCRWATRAQQNRNQRKNVLTPQLVREIRGSSETGTRIAKRLGIAKSTVYEARSGETWSDA